VEGELHHGEAVEEKISLSERFGLWLSFQPFTQDEYLAIVSYWLENLGYAPGLTEEPRKMAQQWALQRGSRSGRVAWQFARDWIGRRGTGA
jgi:predicted AAA+ superfamily ATPase